MYFEIKFSNFTANILDEIGILQLESLSTEKTHVGYIYGGIESTDKNIFFENGENLSSASSRAYKVYLHKGQSNNQEVLLNGSNIIDISIYPKKPCRKLEIIYFAVEKNQINMSIPDSEGLVVVQKTLSLESIGLNDLKLNIAKLSSGAYTLTISDGIHRDSKEFKKK